MIRIYYHQDDLDGMCSAAICKYKFPEAILHGLSYGNPFPWDEIKPDDEVYMVDFCLQPFEDMLHLAQKCRLFWIDHHSSALAEYAKQDGMCGFAGGYTRKDRAACELTWEYLFPDKPVPLAVKLLSLYDSWKFQGHELEDMVLPFQMRMRMEELDPKDWHNGNDGTNREWLSLLLNGYHAKMEVFGHKSISDLVEEGRLLLRYDEQQKAKRPKIICLCGSTRFSQAFTQANLEETLAGNIVLSIGCDTKSDTEIFGHLPFDELERIKRGLDELHKRKIDLADEVLILNVGGYIGKSTRSELEYAKSLRKVIRFLEDANDTE